jgi:hypothetical protein
MLSVRRCAVGALCRLLIALVGIVVSATAQAGTLPVPVRTILFQFHLLLPRPAGGRSSRWVSPSEVFPRSRGKRRSQSASFGSYPLYPLHRAARPAAFLPWVVGLTRSTVPTVLAGGTGEEERAFLALQRPEIFDIGQEFVCPSRRFLMTSCSLACFLTPSPTPMLVAIGGGRVLQWPQSGLVPVLGGLLLCAGRRHLC